MKIWISLAVFFYTISSFAYSFKAGTPCILCNTVIRCGPGIDDVIRPYPNSSKVMTVGEYCVKNSNERDRKYQSIRNVFNNKTRFTYAEYMQNAAVLAEKNLSIEAKPLIHSTNLTNTTNQNDLQNYTEYVLDAIDPKNDKNLEVQKDGTLVTKLDTQPKEVKKDYNNRNSRMPSSERKLEGNGSWVTPEQPGVINPLENSKSNRGSTKKLVTPTPTPYETTTIIIEDSFKRDYCKGKSTADCNDLWQKYNVKEESKKVVEKEPAKRTTASTYVAPTSINPTVNTVPQVAPASTNSSSPPLTTSGNTKPTSVTGTYKPTIANSNPVSKGGSIKQSTSPSVDKIGSHIYDKTQIKLQSQVDTKIARMGTLNTSPVYRKLAVATPYGTLVNVRLQPSGNLLESDRPVCESLDTWRSTSMLIATLKESNPKSEMLVSTLPSNKDILSSDNYCIGNEQRVETCKFDEARASCSCSEYGRQYFLDACGKKFTLKESDPLLAVEECQAKLKSIITDNKDLGGEVSVNKKFASSYAISIGETFLCLDIPKAERKTCSDHIDKKFASMSDDECMGLTQALGPNAKKYLEKNQAQVKKYEWYKLYQHYGKEFKELFKNVDLDIKIAEVSPKQCKTKIRGILETVVSDLNEKYDLEVAKMNPNWLRSLINNDKKVKDRVNELCVTEGCKDLFASFKDDKKSKDDKNAAMASEMKEASSFYRDLSLHVNLSYSHCGQSRAAPTATPSIIPQNNYQQSPLPASGP